MRQSVIRRLVVGCVGVSVFGCVQGVALAQDAQPAAPPAAPLAPAKAAEKADNQQKLITMDFQDVDIAVLVKFISEITNKNFIVDEKVRGKITIISPAKISVDEAYLVFQSVLQVKGFTTVTAGSIIKILATKDAKSSTLDTVLPNKEVTPRDEYITRLIPLKYVDGNNMVAILQPLISPDGLLAAYAPTNTLILIDTAAQTDRMIQILAQLDVESHEQGIEMVRLNYAFAGDIAALLQQVLEEPGTNTPAGAPATQPGAAPDARVRRGTPARPGGGGAGAISGGSSPEHAFRIIPDERTNSLILMAGPLELRRIKDLITRLDVPLPLGTGRIHVYYLKYANSLEMATVLGSLIGGGGGMGGMGMMGGMGGLGGLAGRGSMGGIGGGGFGGGMGSTGFGGGGFGGGGLGGGGLGGGMGSTGFGGGFGGTGGGGFGQTGLGAPSSLGNRGGGLGAGRGLGGFGAAGGLGTGMPGQPGSSFEGIVRLTADPSTNALIINASPQDFETLKEVIEKLDVRRRQVYVEAIIAEVSLTKTRDLGIELQGAAPLPNGVGIGRTNLSGDINSLTTNPTSLQGIILAAASSQTVTIAGVPVPAQQALLRALQTDQNSNILSAPTVLTTDNQPAQIVSGENVPFIASTSTTAVNLANTFNTITRQDVGITLQITPQISEGGTVRLEIYEEVSAVIGTDPQLGPTTSVRSATTTIVAKDGQTTVIGGLLSDTMTNNHDKVPFFADIPVIGNFFKTSHSQNDKTNLLIFLTPHIIRSERDSRNLSVAERERIVQKPFEESGTMAPRWQQLYEPSWEARPSLEPEEEPTPSSGKVQVHKPLRDEPLSEAPKASPPAVAAAVLPAGSSTEPPAAVRPEAAATNGSGSDRYVLLANLWESGTPPASLSSSNGLLALAVPADSGLAELFKKGKSYRFQQTGYSANFECLEVFITPQAAFAAYPEGLRVSRQPATYLHWREPTEPGTLSTASWAPMNGS